MASYDDETLNAAFDAVVEREQLDLSDEEQAAYARDVALRELDEQDCARAGALWAQARQARVQAIRDAALSLDHAAHSVEGASAILAAIEAHDRAVEDARWGGPAPF